MKWSAKSLQNNLCLQEKPMEIDRQPTNQGFSDGFGDFGEHFMIIIQAIYGFGIMCSSCNYQLVTISFCYC